MSKVNLKDHREIGRELDLFFLHKYAPGAAFWLPKGMVIFKELEKYVRDLTLKAGYQETSTPILVKSDIFRISGHYEKFGAHNMFNLPIYEDDEMDSIQKAMTEADADIKKRVKKSGSTPFGYRITYLSENETREVEPLVIPTDLDKGSYTWTLPFNTSLKPMNCPESTLIYSVKKRSYRELPLRISEIGKLHRREKSGEINGLLRVRQLTMDDAHLFVREDQILEEVNNILTTMTNFYKSLGFDYEFKLGTRPEQYKGSLQNWKKAEEKLKLALDSQKLKYSIKEKEGAFYGPKIDMHIKDSIGREWQLATVQIDFALPSEEQFSLKYVDKDGSAKQPVMIHRAIFGSFERFIAILTEHFQGAFPVWLSPIQSIILPVSDKFTDFAQKTADKIRSNGIRAELDKRAETLQAKIRDALLQKIPYILVVGEKEQKSGKVSIRERDKKDLAQMTTDEFVGKIKADIEKKV